MALALSLRQMIRLSRLAVALFLAIVTTSPLAVPSLGHLGLGTSRSGSMAAAPRRDVSVHLNMAVTLPDATQEHLRGRVTAPARRPVFAATVVRMTSGDAATRRSAVAMAAPGTAPLVLRV